MIYNIEVINDAYYTNVEADSPEEVIQLAWAMFIETTPHFKVELVAEQ